MEAPLWNEKRVNVFIRSLEKDEEGYLGQVEAEALRTDVPIIRPEMKSFLRVILQMHRPMRILEVGTAVGFSALLMAENTDPDCRITTIENYPPRIAKAKENLAGCEAGKKIRLLEGDAMDILKELEGPFDLVFMDAAKGQYLNFLPEVKRLLRPGGLLVSDNILQEGDILESHFAVARRDRTIHKRMREYLYELKNSPDWNTSILPVGDGAVVSIRQA